MIVVSQLSRLLGLKTYFVKLTCTLFFFLSLAQNGIGQDFFPLRDVHPGLKGVGRTVFNGNLIEEFQVQILGVLENLTPRQTIILAKLSGGPLGETGVMQGMSGSPVYIDGKLLGAVALGFPFSKEAIAGIQPIEQMIAPDILLPNKVVAVHRQGQYPNFQTGSTDVPVNGSFPSLNPSIGSLKEIFTPLSLSGFTPRTVQAFAENFRRLGFDPQQGVSSGTPASQVLSGKVLPGSMISVQLLSGDMAISADGTVTYVNKNRVYAFGHRFLDSGTTELPFARADVVALLPSVNSSFKLSAAREWAGSITSDLSTAIAGEIGRVARTIPMTISVQSPNGNSHDYNLHVVNDRLLTPFITQTAIFSAIDATERTMGGGTLRVNGEISFEGGTPPLIIQDVFVSDAGVAQQASAEAVVPMGFVLAAGFQSLRVRQIRYKVQPLEEKQQLRIAQAWTSTGQVRPGESVEVNFLLQGENGFETTKSASYRIPAGAPTGPLNITVSDALTLNSPDFAGLSQSALRSSLQLVQAINQYRGSDAAYVRFWRQQPSFVLTGPSPGGELTDPPPSVALILADPSSSPTSSAAATLLRGSQVSEIKVPVGGFVISGARTVQVEVVD